MQKIINYQLVITIFIVEEMLSLHITNNGSIVISYGNFFVEMGK